jgi:hypothetical protein
VMRCKKGRVRVRLPGCCGALVLWYVGDLGGSVVRWVVCSVPFRLSFSLWWFVFSVLRSSAGLAPLLLLLFCFVFQRVLVIRMILLILFSR